MIAGVFWKLVLSAAILMSAIGSSVAWAGNFEQIPTSWRLQNYVGGGVVAFYTASPCANGAISLSSASEAERDRFWSLVMTAKATGHVIGIYYNDTTCEIQSFYEP